jgi:hypothetical protein
MPREDPLVSRRRQFCVPQVRTAFWGRSESTALLDKPAVAPGEPRLSAGPKISCPGE